MLKLCVTLLSILILVGPQSIIGETVFQTIPLHLDVIIQYVKNFDQHYLDIATDLFNTPIATIRPELLLTNASFTTNQSTICEQELEILINATLQRELWALKVFDAWGKPLPSGLLKGNIFWIGNYDECVDQLYTTNNKSYVRQPIDTQYCALQSIPSSQPVSTRSGLVLGLCLPASCTRQSIVLIIHEIFKVYDMNEDNLHCSNDRLNEHNNYLVGTIVFSIFLSLLVLFVLIGTIIDLVVHMYVKMNTNKKPHTNKYHDLSDENSNKNVSLTLVNQSLESLAKKMPFIMFLREFSAICTLRYIFKINKNEKENSFTFLNGIRVLSLFWVILGHSFGSTMFYTSNIVDMAAATRNIAVQLITNGIFGVDTFFLISGFLTTVLFVRQAQKQQLSLRMMVLYYIHRYLRLTPTFILVMFVSIYLTPYFGSGPLYPIQQGLEPDKCRNGNWWTAFLYIGNFLKSDDICLGVTWYLYNDMQFHWIAPLALIPFVMGRKIVGYIVTIFFVLVSMGSILGLFLYYPGMISHVLDASNNKTGPNFFDTVYMSPWCRISPYAIGLLTGFLVVNTSNSYRLNSIVRVIGNFLAIALAMTCIFSMYGDSILMPGVSNVSFIAYQTLSRPAWSISISWLIYLCNIKQGGIVNQILSSPIWSPLARLNYAAYLIHNTMILITVFNQSVPVYFQSMTCLNNYISHLFFSYLAAIIVVIFFEMPFFILEKKFFKR
ncbi:unnamed protein product [Rotaria magnacalcarata]|uniref:Nose resistant-to-fluoxetine protein N-terminal domain-containing protein n=1 Tax=Rotaria magnacalcarata TaxID=392030 RepID=A0A819DVL2_9BILA|nr:unnamed protein product [Rotaria magnacalcarata]CAF3839937.1 unnamed protein product [Rotaria magnacalcarata]